MSTAVAQFGAGNVTSGTQDNAASVSASKPANTADGDLLVAYVFGANSAAVQTPPAGWTQAGGESSVRTAFAWVKPIPSAAAETATSYSWSFTAGTTRLAVVVFRVTNADLSTPIDSIATATTTGVSTITLPAAAPSTANALLLGFWFANDNVATLCVVSPPGTMTEVANASVAPAASTYLEISQEPLSSSGSTGTRTANVSPSSPNGVGGHLLAIKAFPATNVDAATAGATGAAAATAGVGPSPTAASATGDSVFDPTGSGADLQMVSDNPVIAIGAALDPTVSRTNKVTLTPVERSLIPQPITVTAGRTSVTLVPVEMSFSFVTVAPAVVPVRIYRGPFRVESWPIADNARLAVKIQVNQTLYRKNGLWLIGENLTYVDLTDADRVYYGGYELNLSNSQLDELVDAGLGQYVVTI